MNLLSNTNFGRKLTELFEKGIIDGDTYIYLRKNYDEFLDTRSGLWMFRPCNLLGDIMDREPQEADFTKYMITSNEVDHQAFESAKEQFQVAQERVLFDMRDVEVAVTVWDHGVNIWGEYYNTVEQIANDWDEIKLTPKAIEQIGIPESILEYFEREK